MLAYRCKGCGYRFKATDSDLCPECFTARDDIDCYVFSDGDRSHLHGYDSSSGNDFIAQQMREEGIPTREEINEGFRDFSDSVRKAVDNSSYNNAYAPSRAEKPAKKSNAGCVTAIIIIFFILFSGVKNVIHSLFDSISGKDEPDHTFGAEIDSRIDEMEFAETSDSEVASVLDNFKFSRNYYDPYDAFNEYEADQLNFFKNVEETVWHCVTFDIILDKPDQHIKDITLTGSDKDNKPVFLWYIENDDSYGTDNIAYGMPIIFTDDIDTYDLQITCQSDLMEEDFIVYDFTAEKLRSFFGDEIDNEPVVVKYVPSYDYKMGEYQVIMYDTETSSRLKMTGIPREIKPEELGAAMTVTDEQLLSSEWKICDTVIAGSNGYAPAPEDYTYFSLSGYDANGQTAFFCEMNGAPSIPICSRVQNYVLYVNFIDANGFDRTAYFTFTSNDLYNSAS